MNSEPISELPPDVTALSLALSDTTVAEGFEGQRGERYVRVTCRHNNRMLFEVTGSGALTAPKLDRLIAAAAVMRDRCS